ncbi:MAG: RNA methyltransferase [Armatimonadota bacterium]|nr:RNA methyltransferase [Armatimonadota bacterium]MDR7439575.1 RNA methyltransferase [Armatimonadota bacterium]MDR7562746.1 RNA methyltransferase [Armatimonadota bacterium]MDR7568655.1 RNA methyltransferase [Armatimonadota bacterium]MDR7601045.1 RNA methyltransferase [Armatimonadota bacterium]
MITSPKNPHIQELRALTRRRERWAQGRVVVSGVRLVETILRVGGQIEELLVAEPVPELESLARRTGIRMLRVGPRVIEALADVETPQPVCAVVRIPAMRPLSSLRWSRLVVADGIQDPGNMGALVRTADAAGFDALAVLEGTVDPFHPRAIRASAGSCFALPIVRATGEEVQGERVYVADPRGAVDYREADYTPPVVLVFGSEGTGPRHPWPGSARVRIPLLGTAESLNVVAAAAVLLYEARRGG